MVFYVGRKYTTEVSGRRWKRIKCEDCGNEYVYLMARVASGSGHSPYFLNDSGAQSQSESAAGENLSHALSNDFELIPCPDCGAYQSYMVKRLKWRKWGWALAVGLVILLMTPCLWAANPPRPHPYHLWTLGYALFFAIGVGYTAFFWIRSRRFERSVVRGRPTVTQSRDRGQGRLPTRVGSVLRGADYDAMRREAAARKKSPGTISACGKCGKPVLLGASGCRWCGTGTG